MKKEYISPEIEKISVLKNDYCLLETVSSVVNDGFGNNNGEIKDTDFD